jgi:predicted nucleic acid-binding protein
MVILYLDASALVKIYVEETRSGEVSDNAKEAEGLAISGITYPKERAAFARKRR